MTIKAVQHAQFSGEIEAVSDGPCAPALSEEWEISGCGVNQHPTATISWGDGQQPSAATLTKGKCTFYQGKTKPPPGNCLYGVSGTHTYSAPGQYSGTIELKDNCPEECVGTSTASFIAEVEAEPLKLVRPAVGEVQQANNEVTILECVEGGGENPQATIKWGPAESEWGHPLVQSVGLHKPVVHRGGLRSTSWLLDGSTPASVIPPEVCTEWITETHDYGASEPPPEVTVELSDPYRHSELQVAIGAQAAVVTEGAEGESQSAATLRGSVDPDGSEVEECVFEHSTARASVEAGTAERTGCAQALPLTGLARVEVSAALTGLQPGTSYFYRLWARTPIGQKLGDVREFRTLAPVASGAPAVLTLKADGVTKTAAELHGEVNPNGATASSCVFEWGTTIAYGSSAPCNPAAPEGSANVPVAAALSGLTPGTTYHYRVAAANRGSQTSYGSDLQFTTLPTCEVQVTFGYASATGCLAHESSGTYVSTQGSAVSLDGLTLTPDEKTGTITLDTQSESITSAGRFEVAAGDVLLFDGQIRWLNLASSGNLVGPAQGVKLPEMSPPPQARVGGLPFEGSVIVSLNAQKGADIAGNVELPFGPLAGLLEINGKAELHTALGAGLKTDKIVVSREKLNVGSFKLKNLKVVYAPLEDLWEGGAELELPTPTPYNIAAALSFEHDKFHRFAGSVSGLNVAIGPGVFLQKISLVFGVEPVTVGGGIGISFGPELVGTALLKANGNFLFEAAFKEKPSHLHLDGSVELAKFKLANGYFDYYGNGSAKFGVQEQIGLPEYNAPEPRKQPVFLEMSLNGAVSGSKFDALARAAALLNFIDAEAAVEVLVSDRGLAGCAHFKTGPFSWSPGLGYTWATEKLELMWSHCSVGKWQTLPLGTATSAAAEPRLRLGAGGALVGLTGASGQPKVVLKGPGGQTIAVPTTSIKPLSGSGYMVLQDPGDRITYIALQRSSGAWTVQPEEGSSPIVGIRSAPLLPEPRVSATVVGRGSRRSLRWHLTPMEGQEVVFWERASDVSRVIGATSAASGRIAFKPTMIGARRRAIIAQVLGFGLPRKELRVAGFTAAPLPRPGLPAHVRAVKVSGGVRVSWGAARYAELYVVRVHTSGGARLLETAPGSARSVLVPDVVPVHRATVSVTASLVTGLLGPPAKAYLPARSKTTHGKRQASRGRQPLRSPP